MNEIACNEVIVCLRSKGRLKYKPIIKMVLFPTLAWIECSDETFLCPTHSDAFRARIRLNITHTWVRLNASLRRTKGIMDEQLNMKHARHLCRQQIVDSLAISQLRYCISVYGTCRTTTLKKVQKTLNSCARVVAGRRQCDSIIWVYSQLRWLTAEWLTNHHRIALVHAWSASIYGVWNPCAGAQ